MWRWALAHDLTAMQWRRHFYTRRRLCNRIARNFAKRNFAKRDLRAPLIHINRRASRSRSLFKLNYDQIIRALAILTMPDFAALRTAAIQIDRIRV
jgi:hypothetical protein